MLVRKVLASSRGSLCHHVHFTSRNLVHFWLYFIASAFIVFLSKRCLLLSRSDLRSDHPWSVNMSWLLSTCLFKHFLFTKIAFISALGIAIFVVESLCVCVSVSVCRVTCLCARLASRLVCMQATGACVMLRTCLTEGTIQSRLINQGLNEVFLLEHLPATC